MTGESKRAAIDAAAWPRVANVPSGRLIRLRARRAEAEFATACARGDIELDGGVAPDGPELTIYEDALFCRIARDGWLGLAESYLAGEWDTPDSDGLVVVLRKLLRSGYHPRSKKVSRSPDPGGEIPLSLLERYSGDGLTDYGGIFASGIPTTTRTSVDSYAPGAGRRGEPKTHFVDVRTYDEPHQVDRDDLAAAQRRATHQLLDAAEVTPGTHLLVYPGAGVAAAVNAAERRATVDILTADEDFLPGLKDAAIYAGVEDSVHAAVIDQAVPGPQQWRGRYDGIVVIDKLAAATDSQRRVLVGGLDRMLAPGGRAVLQSTVATPALTAAGKGALGALRAYIWPGLDYPETSAVHRLVDRHSGLRIIAETHTGAHAAESLAMQRSFFSGQLREAAASGFDAVFRRLWTYQLALREALMREGMIDSVQFTAVRRNRGGRR